MVRKTLSNVMLFHYKDFYIMLCREKIQLDATQWFIELTIRSTCFGHCYAYHQELETIQVITACGT